MECLCWFDFFQCFNSIFFFFGNVLTFFSNEKEGLIITFVEMKLVSLLPWMTMGIQLFCTIFFCIFGLNCWAVSGFNTMCLISRFDSPNNFLILTKLNFLYRQKGLQVFFKRPVSRWIEGIMMFGSFVIAFAIGFAFMLVFFTHDEIVVFPTPYLFYPVPLLHDSHLWIFYKVCFLIPSGIVMILFVVSVVLALKTNFRIFYYQWRPLFISFYISIMFYFFIHLLFIADDPYNPSFLDF